MYKTTQPVFSELSAADCRVLLERNHVGRLAFAVEGQVDIQPVHYVMGEDWIYGRTSQGTKLRALEHNWRVAIEVDEIDGLFEWRSVVVHGGFYILSPDGTPSEAARWQDAVEALRRLVARTFKEDDPVPFRDVVFGIAVQDVSGRKAETRAV